MERITNNTLNALGEVVRAARKEKGLTQERLGEMVDLGQRHIMSIEKDEKYPSFESMCRIIRVLGINANLIFFPDNAELEDSLIERLLRLLSQFDERELRIVIALVEAYLSSRNKQDYTGVTTD